MKEVIQSSKHSRVARNNVARMVCPALFEVSRYFRFGTDAETWLASVIYAEKLESRFLIFFFKAIERSLVITKLEDFRNREIDG